MEFIIDNIPRHYPTILKHVADQGQRVSPRGLETLEIRGLTILAKDPTRRFLAHPHRRPNPVFPIVELMWYLSGDDSPEPIAHYINNTRKYVNPKTGRFDGAYGPRLKRFSGKIDQIDAVVKRLTHDPSSRRAVITIFDPLIDEDESSLDIPCYALAQFFIRNSKLELLVYARSQDMIRGFVYDTAEWQLLQEMIAGWLGIELGSFTLFIASAHVYAADQALARRIVENDKDFDLYYGVNVDRASCPREESRTIFETYRALDTRLRGLNGVDSRISDLSSAVSQAVERTDNKFWKNAFLAIGAFNAIKLGQERECKRLVERIGNELRPALEMWVRNRKSTSHRGRPIIA